MRSSNIIIFAVVIAILWMILHEKDESKECGAKCYEVAIYIGWNGPKEDKDKVEAILKKRNNVFQKGDFDELRKIRDDLLLRTQLKEMQAETARLFAAPAK